MASLSLRVPLGVGETAASFCSRLALRNGCRSAAEFCRDVGLQFAHVIAGRRAALVRLAELGGVRLDVLFGATLRRSPRGYECGTQSLSVSTVDRNRLRVCPACLLEDMERWNRYGDAGPYSRSIWWLPPIRTCETHSIEIVELPNSKHFASMPLSARQDFTVLLRPSLRELPRWRETARRREPTGLERYLRARIIGTIDVDHNWLAALPFYGVAHACEMFGTAMVKGPRVRVGAFTEDDWREVGEAGFSVLAGGPERIGSELDRLWNTEVPGYGTGLRSYLGEFHRWLDSARSDRSYDPLRDLVRENALNAFAFAPEDVIFGEPVGTRRFHSVQSVSSETGVHHKRLRKMLYAAGLIAEADLVKTNDKTLFPADDRGNEFLERLTTSVPHSKAEAYLNASRTQFELLTEHGFIVPLVESGSNIKKRGFAKSGLDGFLSRLHQCVKPRLDGAPTKVTTISKVARLLHCSSVVVLQLVLDGRLAQVEQIQNASGFRSILVNADEVASLLVPSDEVALSLHQVAKETEWSYRVIEALVVGGLLDSGLTPSPVNHRPRHMIHRSSLDDFRRRYVSQKSLAANRGVDLHQIKTELDRMGIRPAFNPPKRITEIFYKREDVACIAN